MAVPNVPNGIQYHAGGLFTGIGPVIQFSTNVLQFIRNGVGDYTIIFGTEIDVSQRDVQLTLFDTAPGSIMEDAGGATAPDRVNIKSFNTAGAAADRTFTLSVLRRES